MTTRVLLRSMAAAAAILGMTTGAFAAFINIPGVSFVPRDVGVGTSDPGEVIQGMLGNAEGRYYAPVVFPSAGNVCAFYLVYRDSDSESNLTARLFRKAFAAGGDAFTPPVLMAQINPGGANPNTRRSSDTTITQPAVNLSNSFYYVELVVPLQALEVFGVQIDFRTTACP